MSSKTMFNAPGKKAGFAADRAHDGARGAALLITLILLALLSAASVAMVLLVSSDTMINGYYRNYRGSFYAADSGVNVVVQSIANSVKGNANNAANPPLPLNGVPAAVTASYAPYQASYYSIVDPGSWKAQFQLIANPDGNPVLSAASGCVSSPNANDGNSPGNGDLVWTCTYPYEVTVKGQSAGTEAEEITENGIVRYSNITGTLAAGGPPKFSKWGAFITKFGDCQGALVPGTMTGPFFTDGQWNFGNYSNPGYTFTDTVGQAGANVSWWTNQCTDSPTAPKGFKAPTFQNGLQLSQNTVTPPSNTYNQAQAVLDGKGTPPCTVTPCAPDPPPSQSQMNNELKTVKGVAYPASGAAPTGVFIPYYTNSSGQKVYGSNPATGGDGAGGGFYINGNASITLAATTGGDGTTNPTQTYTITQGSTTTTIILDNVAGLTTVSSGGTTLSLAGIPQQLDPNTGQAIVQNDPSGNAVNPALLYVNGAITGLNGTVQNNEGITVVASSSVSITGDLTYMQSPVSIPADTLNASTNAGVLGIFTTSNINLYPNSNGNLTVNASLAAIGSGSSGFATPGGSIGTWTIVGGRAEDQAHSVNISTGNTYYDRRFANNFGPPWFPTAVPQPGQAGIPAGPVHMSVTRLSWKEVNR
ncbi:MAG: hypothetical protein DMG99_01290 [Acidobacteria bacterium]|jgi:hypothetical protein|nr:MAG: hypothetical protein DMF61_27210 [Blastocatellia bacterium AA13]PYQ45610.1 MAG: hypothetical protein DMG99_01290 [Acidobacteriota bacterium]